MQGISMTMTLWKPDNSYTKFKGNIHAKHEMQTELGFYSIVLNMLQNLLRFAE